LLICWRSLALLASRAASPLAACAGDSPGDDEADDVPGDEDEVAGEVDEAGEDDAAGDVDAADREVRVCADGDVEDAESATAG